MDKDLLDLLLRHAGADMMEAAVRDAAIRDMAAAWKVETTMEALQGAADRFRLERDLLSYEDTRAWLGDNWLSERNWQNLLAVDVQTHSLIVSERIAGSVECEFAGRRDDYARALLARLVVDDEGLAHELFMACFDGKGDFDVLVRRYSIETSRTSPAPPPTRRWFFRFELPPPVAGGAFAGMSSGPLMMPPIEMGDRWHVYRILKTCDPVLDEETRSAIAGRLFEAALQPFIAAARVRLRAHAGIEPAAAS
jgi:hypothetical protein